MAKYPEVKILPDDDYHWDLSRSGDIEARNYIVEYHMQLVIQIVHSLMRKLPNSVEKDDLIGYGSFGLIKAAETYDPKRSKFITHAAFRINNAIYDGLRKEDWAPKSLRRNLKDIEQARSQLFSANGQEPSNEDIADYIGKKESWVSDLMKIEDTAKPVLLSKTDANRNHLQALEQVMSATELFEDTIEERSQANSYQSKFVLWLSGIDDDLKVLWYALNFMKMSPRDSRDFLGLATQEYSNLRKRLNASFEDFLNNLRQNEFDNSQEV